METPQHVDNLFVFEKGSKSTIIKDNHGTINVGTGAHDGADQTEADEKVQMAIDDLYDEKDEKGKKFFNDKKHWYAVYRVLKEYCNYPEKMTDFSRQVERENLSTQEPICVYGSLKAAQSDLPMLACKVSQWALYCKLGDKYKKQYLIAQFLLKKLGFEQ